MYWSYSLVPPFVTRLAQMPSDARAGGFRGRSGGLEHLHRGIGTSTDSSAFTQALLAPQPPSPTSRERAGGVWSEDARLEGMTQPAPNETADVLDVSTDLVDRGMWSDAWEASSNWDWDKPTLEMLAPNINIAQEEFLFPLAAADDGELLPSELHPSYPYANQYDDEPNVGSSTYASKPKLPPGLHLQYKVAGETQALEGIGTNNERHTREKSRRGVAGKKKGSSSSSSTSLPPHLRLRAQHDTIANSPPWPFKRFGTGPGGPSALLRAEKMHPWRPYQEVWAELGLEELLCDTDEEPNPLHVGPMMLRNREDVPSKVNNKRYSRQDQEMEGELYEYDQSKHRVEETRNLQAQKVAERQRLKRRWGESNVYS